MLWIYSTPAVYWTALAQYCLVSYARVSAKRQDAHFTMKNQNFFFKMDYLRELIGQGNPLPTACWTLWTHYVHSLSDLTSGNTEGLLFLCLCNAGLVKQSKQLAADGFECSWKETVISTKSMVGKGLRSPQILNVTQFLSSRIFEWAVWHFFFYSFSQNDSFKVELEPSFFLKASATIFLFLST